MSWRTNGRTPIGIDLGSTTIKAAQLAPTRSGMRLTAGAHYQRLEPGGGLSAVELERLLHVLDRAGFVGDSVVLGAPRSMVRSAVVDAPPASSGAPVRQICGAEFARMFRLSPSGCQLHISEIPSANERASTCQMSISGMSSEDAERLVVPFDRVGMLVEAIDLCSAARSRACLPVCGELETLTALLDVGMSGIGLSVFRDGASVYHRWLAGAGVGRLIDMAGRSFAVDAAAAEVLVGRVGLIAPSDMNVDPLAVARILALGREYAEGLFQDILRSLAYVLDRFPGESVERFFMIGGGATLPGLTEYLSELSGLEMETLTPARCGVSGGPLTNSPTMHTAIGHAMWRGNHGE